MKLKKNEKTKKQTDSQKKNIKKKPFRFYASPFPLWPNKRYHNFDVVLAFRVQNRNPLSSSAVFARARATSAFRGALAAHRRYRLRFFRGEHRFDQGGVCCEIEVRHFGPE